MDFSDLGTKKKGFKLLAVCAKKQSAVLSCGRQKEHCITMKKQLIRKGYSFKLLWMLLKMFMPAKKDYK